MENDFCGGRLRKNLRRNEFLNVFQTGLANMLNAKQVLDKEFLETRCMLIEIAATLDRFDRALQADQDRSALQDDRLAILYRAIDLIASRDAAPDRAERMLNLFTELAE